MTTYLTLGRIGDLLNVAQICWHEYQRTNEKVRLVVAQEFAPTLDGFSYIEPVIFDGHQDELPRAMGEFPDAVVLQSWQNPDPAQCDSYQKEPWRRAGKLDLFGSVPLVIDRRNLDREAQFCSEFDLSGRMVLVSTYSPSSPFNHSTELVETLVLLLPKHNVVDLRIFNAHRFYDLLGLLDRAALLVTVDTAHLHLARASRVPVIAIVNDVGTSASPGPWTASVPPPQTIETVKYSEFGDYDCMFPIAVKAIRALKKSRPHIFHAVQMFGKEKRHLDAQATWNGLFDGTVTPISHVTRTAKNIGDKRALPYLKDVLNPHTGNANDIVFWCNDDNALSENLPAFLSKHVPLYGACAFRRTEPGTQGIHCGAEAFAFTRRWLWKHWNEIPDYLLAASSWDIGLRAFIRLERGIVTTKANLTHDFWPCDVGEGYVFHEPHPSAWSGANENSPSNQWNRKLLKDWQRQHLPQVKETLA